MFGFGATELLIVLVLILVVFGAGKLPEIGGALGKGIQSFRSAVQKNDEIEVASESDESPQKD